MDYHRKDWYLEPSRTPNMLREKLSRRKTLGGLVAIGGAGLLGLSSPAAAKPDKGNPGASDCDLHVNKEDDDNYDSIQAAVDDADAGDTICVAPEGTYHENVLIQTEDITLQQQGNGNAPNPTVDPQDDSVQPIRIKADGVTVDGINVTGGHKGLVATTGDLSDPLKDITFKNLEAYGNANDGTTFWRVRDSLVENVKAYNNGDNGIYANGPNNTVRGSVAHDNGDQGIDMSNDYDTSAGVDENWGGATVENSLSHHNGNGGIELDDDEGDSAVNDCHTHDNDVESENDASGLVLNNTSSVESVTGNEFEDGIAIGGLDTDP